LTCTVAETVGTTSSYTAMWVAYMIRGEGERERERLEYCIDHKTQSKLYD
jgi:hypothetical protein